MIPGYLYGLVPLALIGGWLVFKLALGRSLTDAEVGLCALLYALSFGVMIGKYLP